MLKFTISIYGAYPFLGSLRASAGTWMIILIIGLGIGALLSRLMDIPILLRWTWAIHRFFSVCLWCMALLLIGCDLMAILTPNWYLTSECCLSCSFHCWKAIWLNDVLGLVNERKIWVWYSDGQYNHNNISQYFLHYWSYYNIWWYINFQSNLLEKMTKDSNADCDFQPVFEVCLLKYSSYSIYLPT